MHGPVRRVQFVVFEIWCLLHQIAREIMLQLVNNLQEKKDQRKSRQTKFWKRARTVLICTRFTTLNPCYTRMYSFSANQKCIMYIIKMEASGAKTVSREAQHMAGETFFFVIIPQFFIEHQHEITPISYPPFSFISSY